MFILNRLKRLFENRYQPAASRSHNQTDINGCEGIFWQYVDPEIHWLFLDIDGVLHRAENGSLEFMPILSNLLSRNPNVGIILSTNWRIGVEPNAILSIFPANIKDRIAGGTPDLNGKVNEHIRWHECMTVVKAYGLKKYTFVDDTQRLFPDNCTSLFLTSRSVGLNTSAAEQLEERIRASIHWLS